MSSFAAMKKSRKSQFDTLRQKVETDKSGGGSSDDRYWKPTQDKTGAGYAVIRFLPTSKVDAEKAEAQGIQAMPFVQYYRHMFKTPAGKWFVNNCPTTIGEECPVCKANSELWNTEIPSNQDIVRKRKRQQKYVANILVVKDSGDPSNDGKVFLYEFGTKIFQKIEAMMFPEFEDEVAVDPFDFWEGANFKLKIRKVDGYTNYDKSEFDSVEPISDDDDVIEGYWNQSHSLLEFVEPGKFKSFEKLAHEYQRALGGSAPANDTVESAPEPEAHSKPLPVEDPVDNGVDAEDSENMEFFQNMLDED